MYSRLKKSVIFFTLLCFLNTSIAYSHVEIPDRSSSDVGISYGMANPKFKLSLSTLIFPYYIGKLCIYGYRFHKLKKDNVKDFVKLTKKCKKCCRKIGFKIKISEYIDDVCWAAEEKTGHSLSDVNKEVKKLFGCKAKKKGFDLDVDDEIELEDDEIEDDIDFNNIVERSIMEIVEKNGGITQAEYEACLRMDPELNMDGEVLYQNHIQGMEYFSSIVRAKHTDFDIKNFYAKGNDLEDAPKYGNVSTKLAIYVTIGCAGAFLSLVPFPPINGIGYVVASIGYGGVISVLIDDFGDKYDRGEINWGSEPSETN